MPGFRKIAVLVFTDIAGFSALMSRDETLALQTLEVNRNIHKNLIERFGGIFLKEMGDGIMASFPNSSDAVKCAVQIQKQCKEENIRLRIGMNQGEVTFQNGDVFGDGVNIAAHLESLAVPNSILLSRATNDQLRNKPEFRTQSLGRFKLKKIDEPQEVFALTGSGLEVPSKSHLSKHKIVQSKSSASSYIKFAGIPLLIILLGYLIFNFAFQNKTGSDNRDSSAFSKGTSPVNSIAVLPFLNMSGIAEQEYFSDGMMEEVLNKLFHIEELTVISRTSTMKYKNSDLLASQIAKELGVSNILEGSVQTDQGNVRINMKLIDGKTDAQKWSHTYDEELKDIFSLQTAIAQDVADQLEIQLNPSVKSRMESASTEDPEVWKLFMRAKHIAAQFNDIQKSDSLLKEAISIDQNFAPAYAERGFMWLSRGSFEGDLGPEEILDSVYLYLNKAKEINPDYPGTHSYLALVNLWFKWDFESAEKEWITFYTLNPSNRSNDPGYVDFLNAAGRFDEAVAVSNRILKSDASSASSWSTTGLSFYFAGDPEKANSHYEEALELFPITSIVSDASRTFVYSGRYDRAIEILEGETSDLQSASSRSLGNIAISYFHTGNEARLNEILDVLLDRTKSITAGSPSYYTAMVMAQMGKIDDAFNYLDLAFQNKEVEMFWLNVEPPFDPLRQDPRWKEIIQKVGY